MESASFYTTFELLRVRSLGIFNKSDAAGLQISSDPGSIKIAVLQRRDRNPLWLSRLIYLILPGVGHFESGSRSPGLARFRRLTSREYFNRQRPTQE